MPTNNIGILGAGLVGSLLASNLSRKGFDVHLFEMRPDPRKAGVSQGRSINLALSHRGIRALKEASVFDLVQPELIPMRGRMMHDLQGNLTIQPYGNPHQHLNSVSRNGLNKVLIDFAEKQGAKIHFSAKCDDLDLEQGSILLESGEKVSFNALVGADGAFSVVRQKMQRTDRFNFQQLYLEHGYKELSIPAKDGNFAMEPNYLHIWPRGKFMLIALPNIDGSFTCTLFFPFEGPTSFSSLADEGDIRTFFEGHFPDVIKLIPDLVKQFQDNPTSSLVTIRSSPWHRGKALLIGDAAHAIVPFYGQGMNAGFEDCRLFMEWGQKLGYDWHKLFRYFSDHRKTDADAISELALQNFIEMRDKVADQHFLNLKKLERRLTEAYPKEWIPNYTMVTFSDIPYSEAQRIGKIQTKILSEIPKDFEPLEIDLKPIIKSLVSLSQGDR